MTIILLVGAGGFAGAVARYLINREVQQLFASATGFPYGVLAVNALGCFIIGFLGGLAAAHGILGNGSSGRAFLFVGVLGGFTTFSAFGYDTLELARAGNFTLAAGNVVLQLVLGLGAVWVGYKLAVW